MLELNQLMEDLIKDYETSETHSILFYSLDKTRDFNILTEKVKAYRNRFNTLLANGKISTSETGDKLREEDLSRELL